MRINLNPELRVGQGLLCVRPSFYRLRRQRHRQRHHHVGQDLRAPPADRPVLSTVNQPNCPSAKQRVGHVHSDVRFDLQVPFSPDSFPSDSTAPFRANCHPSSHLKNVTSVRTHMSPPHVRTTKPCQREERTPSRRRPQVFAAAPHPENSNHSDTDDLRRTTVQAARTVQYE